MNLLHACMCGHKRDATLLEEVGDDVCVEASLYAYCEDSVLTKGWFLI